jgi:hypothetical protein
MQQYRKPKIIQSLLKQKKHLYKKFRANQASKNEYKLKCKEYEKAINRWQNYSEDKLCEDPSSKKFYDFVNKKLKNHSSIPALVDKNNCLIYKDTEKADIFNKYFQQIFSKSFYS